MPNDVIYDRDKNRVSFRLNNGEKINFYGTETESIDPNLLGYKDKLTCFKITKVSAYSFENGTSGYVYGGQIIPLNEAIKHLEIVGGGVEESHVGPEKIALIS